MTRPILIVASPTVARKLAAMLGDRRSVIQCSDRERAAALASTGSYLAILAEAGYVRVVNDAPIVEISNAAAPGILERLAEIESCVRLDQRARAEDQAHLATLPYVEYLALARARATRDYLLALLHRHHGVVTEAARAAGILRETLHRLLRRHDVAPDWFRHDHE